MSIFPQEILDRRRKRLSDSLDSLLSDGDCVLFFCGKPIQKPGGLDQTYYFLPHPTYFWITGIRRPEGVTLYSKNQGWIDFAKPISPAEKLWENFEETVEGTKDIAGLEHFLKAQKFNQIFEFGQITDSFSSMNPDSGSKQLLQEKINLARREKDDFEIKLIESIAEIANQGYKKIKAFIKPGVTEKEIQIEFEAEIQRHGSHRTPYDTIVGSGKNAAVLHAIPTRKKVLKNEIVLIDAGADIYDYCVDITRVFPSSGFFTAQQQDIHDIVLNAQAAAIKKCRIGTNWPDVHRTSAHIIADGLKALNLLKGDLDSILESGAISVFYPHGVGHLVGLRVRDVGQEENKNPKKYCGVTLRVDLKLQKNYLITVEPGCYFIESMIADSDVRTKYQDFINWNEVEKWKDVGGVRLEDDILITDHEPRNLTGLVEKV